MMKVLTIDGPSGSGKSSTAQMVAAKLGWHIVDSGAIYRAFAFVIAEKNITVDDAQKMHQNKLSEIAQKMRLEFSPAKNETVLRILLNENDVSAKLRTEKTGKYASQLAQIPAVRQALLARQRAFLKPPGLVAEGRDMGTVVFPDAWLKFFLTANIHERTKRRVLQLQDDDKNIKMDAVLNEMEERDARDKNRKTAPLVPASDAILVDTSRLSPDAVVKKIMTKVHLKNQKMLV